MTTTSKYRIGLRFGLITGGLYVVLLFIRYRFCGSTPHSFYLLALLSYLFILMMYLFAGIARKKELNGYAEIRDIFQSIFIVILITEFLYVIFNFVYLKYIDPHFLDRFHDTCQHFYQQQGLSPFQVDEQMKGVKAMSDAVKPEGLIKGFGAIVVVDSIFGFLFSIIIRRKKPIPAEPK